MLTSPSIISLIGIVLPSTGYVLPIIGTVVPIKGQVFPYAGISRSCIQYPSADHLGLFGSNFLDVIASPFCLGGHVLLCRISLLIFISFRLN